MNNDVRGGHRLDGPTVISGVFTIPFSATEQVFAAAAAEGLPEPARGSRAAGQGRAYRLEFIAGPENHLAGAAARNVLDSASSLGKISPVVLYGPTGCGKSHLAQGIAQAWRQLRSSPRGIVTMSAGDWSPKLLPLKRFVAPATAESTPANGSAESPGPSSETYAIELLVLEDLHLLRQTPATFTHFRAVLDELSSSSVPLVFTSRVPPSELKAWPADLRARLQCGMLVPIAPPAEETRYALLQAMAELWQIRLTPAAAARLAQGLAEPAPQLLVSLARLCADVAGLQRPISEDDVEQFLTRCQPRTTIELPRIAKCVLRRFGLQMSDLAGKSRRRHIVAARSVVMYLARDLTGLSLAQIGRYCGGRDHTTTLHNCRKIAEQLNTDPQLRTTINELRRELIPG